MKLTEEQVDYIQDILKSQLGNSVQDLKINTIKGGYSNLSYLLESTENKYVLRRAPLGSKGIKGGHDMLREANILETLSQNGYAKVPKVILKGEEDSVLETAFYIMEFLDGKIYRMEYAKENPELFDAKYSLKISQNLIKEQANLHKIEIANTSLYGLGKPEGYINRQVQGWYQRFNNVELEPFTDLHYVYDFLNANLPAEIKPSIIHNDFKFDNVIFDHNDGEIKAVLDWEMATIGDPRMDLGTSLAYWTEALDEAFEKNFNISSLPGFPSKRDYISYYLSINNICAEEELLFFYVFGLFKNAVVIMQIYFRYKNGFSSDPRFEKINYVAKRLISKAINSIKINKLL